MENNKHTSARRCSCRRACNACSASKPITASSSGRGIIPCANSPAAAPAAACSCSVRFGSDPSALPRLRPRVSCPRRSSSRHSWRGKRWASTNRNKRAELCIYGACGAVEHNNEATTYNTKSRQQFPRAKPWLLASRQRQQQLQQQQQQQLTIRSSASPRRTPAFLRAFLSDPAVTKTPPAPSSGAARRSSRAPGPSRIEEGSRETCTSA